MDHKDVVLTLDDLEFDGTNTAPKTRFLILNDIKQDMPSERLRIIGGGVRVGKTSGKPYKWYLLQGDSGDEWESTLWARDVTSCAKEWGDKPKNWGFLKIQLNKAKTAYELVPHENQLTHEEVVA